LRPEPTHSVEPGHCTALDGLVDRKQPSLDLAVELLARLRAEAEASSLALAMCVVDASGHVIASQRMDGAPLGAMRLAVGKAYTAVLWGARTGDFMKSTQPGGADWGWNTTDERVVVYAGGLPLYAEGALVGGAGASGGTAEQDEACVIAAVRSLGFAFEA
jgi:glc operon protein GlcG